MSSMRLKDKVAVVTGGARGIGAAICERFAAEGARVVVADMDPLAGDETVGRIKAADGKARFVACDVTRREQVSALMDRALEAYGSLDIVVANAEGNVVGLMPHPERASDLLLGSADGRLLLEALLTSASASV